MLIAYQIENDSFENLQDKNDETYEDSMISTSDDPKKGIVGILTQGKHQKLILKHV